METEALQETTTAQTETGQASEVTKNTDTAEHMIPKSRFDEVNNRLKELQTAQEQAAKEREKQQQKQLEEQNRFKELYEQATARISELEPFQERYTSYEQQVSERNTARIEAIPEAMRSLVPEYDDPFRMQSWLDSNESVFTKPAAPKLDGGAGGNTRRAGESLPTLAEIKSLAAVLNVSEKHLKQYYGIE